MPYPFASRRVEYEYCYCSCVGRGASTPRLVKPRDPLSDDRFPIFSGPVPSPRFLLQSLPVAARSICHADPREIDAAAWPYPPTPFRWARSPLPPPAGFIPHQSSSSPPLQPLIRRLTTQRETAQCFPTYCRMRFSSGLLTPASMLCLAFSVLAQV